MKKIREINLKELLATIKFRTIVNITAMVAGFFILFFIDNLFPVDKLTWPLQFVRGIIGAVMGGIISDWIYFWKWGFKEFHISCLKEISDKTENILEPVAFYTNDNKLGLVMERTRQINGKVKWLAAKFISRSLSQTFSDSNKVVFYLEKPKQYSEFLTHVMRECESSIWWTCPYTPKKWFEYLCQKQDGSIDEGKMEKVTNGRLSIDDVPSHFSWFIKLNQLSRRRIVILTDNEWETDLTNPSNEIYFKEFTKFFGKKQTVIDKMMRFVKESELNSDQKPWKSSKPWDYGIYDNELLIKWDEHGKYCELILSLEAVHKKIFIDMLSSLDFKTVSMVQSEIDRKKIT
jgi:hypothetical protein